MQTLNVKHKVGRLAAGLSFAVFLAACGSGGGSDGSTSAAGFNGSTLTAAQARPASCENMSNENYVVRNELAPGNPTADRCCWPRLMISAHFI